MIQFELNNGVYKDSDTSGNKWYHKAIPYFPLKASPCLFKLRLDFGPISNKSGILRCEAYYSKGLFDLNVKYCITYLIQGGACSRSSV